MTTSDWKFGSCLRKLREDINLLAWLFEEEKFRNARRPRTSSEEEVEPYHGKAHTSLNSPPT